VVEENQRKKRVGSATKRKFFIKATITTTYEEAKRAVAEAQALRHLPVDRNILKMIDSGCATFGPGIGQHDVNGAELINKHRTYCLLFKGSLRRSVRDIMEKHRRKLEKCLRLSVGTSRGAQNTGWMDIKTVMGIFRQMAVAVSVLHGPTEKHGKKELNAQRRIIHMDLRPDHFCVYKGKTSSEGCWEM
jgi:hypothetical protein